MTLAAGLYGRERVSPQMEHPGFMEHPREVTDSSRIAEVAVTAGPGWKTGFTVPLFLCTDGNGCHRVLLVTGRTSGRFVRCPTDWSATGSTIQRKSGPHVDVDVTIIVARSTALLSSQRGTSHTASAS